MGHISLRRCAAGPIAVLAAITLALSLVSVGCSGARSAIRVTLLAVGTLGPDPFLGEPIGIDLLNVGSRRKGGKRRGDTPGLYGGTRNASKCDKQKLTRFLQGDVVKGKAWAGVRKIRQAEVARHVGRLTSVILRADTLVTNHGFKGGKATAFQAVLQAGVAVLVDERGAPAVKCNCGNPLTTADLGQKKRYEPYQGKSWRDFSDKQVAAVEPEDTVTQLTLIDPATNTAFDRPIGSDGSQDEAAQGPVSDPFNGTPMPASPTESVTTPIPTTTPPQTGTTTPEPSTS